MAVKATAALRAALARGGVLAPFVGDPLSALLAQRMGFTAAYLGGGALGYLLGVTEARLTSTEVAAIARQITNVCDLPLLVDGTTGFGDPIHVLRTVRELERAGAAGIEIEDQLAPKRAHHERRIDHPVTLEQMLEKIEAALAAREDPDFLVIARTNTFAEIGFDEGLRRAKAFAEAGADMVLASPRIEAEVRRLPGEVSGPLVGMTIAAGQRPRFTPEELFALGYPLVLEAQAPMLAAYAAMRRAYDSLRTQGFVPLDADELRAVRTEIHELCDLPRLWALEERTTERPERIPAP